jgi:hypothetical protein
MLPSLCPSCWQRRRYAAQAVAADGDDLDRRELAQGHGVAVIPVLLQLALQPQGTVGGTGASHSR